MLPSVGVWGLGGRCDGWSNEDWRGAAEEDVAVTGEVTGDISEGRRRAAGPAEQWRVNWAGPVWIWAFQIIRT